MIIGVCFFSVQGEKLTKELFRDWEGVTARYRSRETELSEWTGECFEKRLPVLFVGACGIAVRAIAPYVKDKLSDSPVLVMDEKGSYVIPLLSGHVGGANELARKIAERVGAQAVITTATDVEGLFSVDVFAQKNGLRIQNREGIRHVSAKLLRGETVTIAVPKTYLPEDFRDEMLPKGIRLFWQDCREEGETEMGTQEPELQTKSADQREMEPELPVPDIRIAYAQKSFQPGRQDLLLVPKTYVLGIGCRKGKTFEELLGFLKQNLPEGFENEICMVASIDLKAQEEGLAELAQYLHVPFFTFSAQELEAQQGDFTQSDFVKQVTGVSNVCERAAVCGAGEGGELVIRKIAQDGITMAAATRRPVITCWDT